MGLARMNRPNRLLTSPEETPVEPSRPTGYPIGQPTGSQQAGPQQAGPQQLLGRPVGSSGPPDPSAGPSRPGAPEELGFLNEIAQGGNRFVTGLVGGLVDDPLFGLLINILPEADEAKARALSNQMQGSTAGEAGVFIGRTLGFLVPFMAGGFAGRAFADVAIRSMAKTLAKKGMVDLAAAQTPGVGGIAVQLARVAKATPGVITPIERAAQLVGAGVGEGAVEVPRGLADSKNMGQILDQAIETAALGIAFEGAFIGLGLLSGKGRAGFTLKERRVNPKVEARASAAFGGAVAEIKAIDNVISDLLEVEVMETQLAKVWQNTNKGRFAKGRQLVVKVDAKGRSLVDLPSIGIKKGAFVPKSMRGTLDAAEGAPIVIGTRKGAQPRPGVKKPTLVQLRRNRSTPDLELADEAGDLVNLGLSKAERSKLDLLIQKKRAKATISQGIDRIYGRGGRAFGSPGTGPIPATFTRARPATARQASAGLFSEVRRLKDKGMDAVLRSPESFIGSGPETQVRVVAALNMAENEITVAVNVAAEQLRRGRKRAMKLLGVSERQASKEGRLLEIMEDFEVNGDIDGFKVVLQEQFGLGSSQADEVARIFDDLSTFQNEMQRLAKQSGSRPDLDLEDFGVKKFFTHTTDNLSGRDLSDILNERGYTASAIDDIIGKLDDLDVWGEEVAKSGVAKALREAGDSRPPVQQLTAMKRFGGFDMNRIFKGSGWQKYKKDGLPILPDPFDAALRFGSQAIRRHELAPIVGRKGELADLYYQAVQIEGGKETALRFRNMMYNYLDNKFYDQGMRRLARVTTGANVMSKMTFSVLSNMTQPALTNMTFGTMKSLKGLSVVFKKEARDDLARITAVNHSILADTGRLLGEEGIAVLGIEKVARSTLKWSGFNVFERFNRVHAAASGGFFIRDNIVKSVAGRLRGRNLHNKRRMFQEMGLDLDAVTQEIKIIGGEGNLAKATGDFLASDRWIHIEKNALFEAAKKTQFVPTKMTRPPMWNHPAGRVAFQFKTFAMQQGRLIRDGVFAEATLGNVAPLARFVAINPLVGEVFADLKAFASNRPRRSDPDDLVARWVDDVAFLGGWGLATDMIESAQAQDMVSFVLGPTVDSVQKMFQAAARLDADMGLREFFKLPVTNATIQLIHLGSKISNSVGDAPKRAIEKYIDTLPEAVREPREVFTLDRLVQEDARDKQ